MSPTVKTKLSLYFPSSLDKKKKYWPLWVAETSVFVSILQHLCLPGRAESFFLLIYEVINISKLKSLADNNMEHPGCQRERCCACGQARGLLLVQCFACPQCLAVLSVLANSNSVQSMTAPACTVHCTEVHWIVRYWLARPWRLGELLLVSLCRDTHYNSPRLIYFHGCWNVSGPLENLL